MATSTSPSALSWRFIPGVLLAAILNPLNSSTIAVAIPILLEVFHGNAASVTWIVSGYYIGSAVVQPIMGKLGDQIGHRRLVFLGMLGVSVTALAAPFSQSLGMLIGLRVVQAMGTATVYPNAVGLIRQYYRHRQNQMFAWIGLAAGIALSVGPTLGGFLLEAFTWRSIFLLNIPLLAIAGGLLYGAVPPDPRPSAAIVRRSPFRQFDILGALTFAVAVLAGLAGLQTLSRPAGWLGLAVALGLIPVLMRVEHRAENPLIRFSLFRFRNFSLGAFMTVWVNLIMYSVLYGFPLYLETVRHFSAAQTGLILLVYAGLQAAISPLGAVMARNKMRRGSILTATAAMAAGCLPLTHLLELPVWGLLAGISFIGMGFSLLNILLQLLLLDAVSVEETGVVTGMYMMLRYVGTIASSVGISLALAGGARGEQSLFVVLSVAALVATATSLFIVRPSPRP